MNFEDKSNRTTEISGTATQIPESQDGQSKLSPQTFQVDMKFSYSDIKPSRFQHIKLSIFCIFFGLGTWLPVNTLYSQMPLLVHFSPEHWSLPSYLIIIVQVANLAPALYSYFRKSLEYMANNLIIIFLVLGTVSLLASAFSYDITFEIFEYERSVCFFVISLLCSLVGCVSPVLFLPFMNALPEEYLVPYFSGVSSSGLVPSTLALIQGVKRPQCKNITASGVNIITREEEPLFGSKIFFLVSSSLMFISTISFLYLKKYSELHDKPNIEKSVLKKEPNPKICKKLYYLLMILQAVVNCFQNGILMSIQSYSCLRYGVGAYHWSLNLNQMIGPLAMYIGSYFSLLSLRVLAIAFILFVMCVGYEMTTALISSPPPFVDYTTLGPLHIVLVWVLGSGLISFVKLSTATILRRYNAKALFYYGAMTQIGSASGALLSFIFINYTSLFQSKVMKIC